MSYSEWDLQQAKEQLQRELKYQKDSGLPNAKRLQDRYDEINKIEKSLGYTPTQFAGGDIDPGVQKAYQELVSAQATQKKADAERQQRLSSAQAELAKMDNEEKKASGQMRLVLQKRNAVKRKELENTVQSILKQPQELTPEMVNAKTHINEAIRNTPNPNGPTSSLINNINEQNPGILESIGNSGMAQYELDQQAESRKSQIQQLKSAVKKNDFAKVSELVAGLELSPQELKEFQGLATNKEMVSALADAGIKVSQGQGTPGAPLLSDYQTAMLTDPAGDPAKKRQILESIRGAYNGPQMVALEDALKRGDVNAVQNTIKSINASGATMGPVKGIEGLKAAGGAQVQREKLPMNAGAYGMVNPAGDKPNPEDFTQKTFLNGAPIDNPVLNESAYNAALDAWKAAGGRDTGYEAEAAPSKTDPKFNVGGKFDENAYNLEKDAWSKRQPVTYKSEAQRDAVAGSYYVDPRILGVGGDQMALGRAMGGDHLRDLRAFGIKQTRADRALSEAANGGASLPDVRHAVKSAAALDPTLSKSESSNQDQARQGFYNMGMTSEQVESALKSQFGSKYVDPSGVRPDDAVQKMATDYISKASSPLAQRFKNTVNDLIKNGWSPQDALAEAERRDGDGAKAMKYDADPASRPAPNLGKPIGGDPTKNLNDPNSLASQIAANDAKDQDIWAKRIAEKRDYYLKNFGHSHTPEQIEETLKQEFPGKYEQYGKATSPDPLRGVKPVGSSAPSAAPAPAAATPPSPSNSGDTGHNPYMNPVASGGTPGGLTPTASATPAPEKAPDPLAGLTPVGQTKPAPTGGSVTGNNISQPTQTDPLKPKAPTSW